MLPFTSSANASGFSPPVNEDMSCSSVGQVIYFAGTGQGNASYSSPDWSCGGTPISTYNSSGTETNKNHIVTGSTSLSLGSSTVNFSGNSIFSNSSSYICIGNDTNGSALAVSSQNQSGAQVKFFGTLSDTIAYICIGN